VLTEAGAPIAAFCQSVMAQRERLGLAPGRLPRGLLPLIARLGHDRARFSALKTGALCR
jgi:hypothetical protein